MNKSDVDRRLVPSTHTRDWVSCKLYHMHVAVRLLLKGSCVSRMLLQDH